MRPRRPASTASAMTEASRTFPCWESSSPFDTRGSPCGFGAAARPPIAAARTSSEGSASSLARNASESGPARAATTSAAPARTRSSEWRVMNPFAWRADAVAGLATLARAASAAIRTWGSSSASRPRASASPSSDAGKSPSATAAARRTRSSVALSFGAISEIAEGSAVIPRATRAVATSICCFASREISISFPALFGRRRRPIASVAARRASRERPDRTCTTSASSAAGSSYRPSASDAASGSPRDCSDTTRLSGSSARGSRSSPRISAAFQEKNWLPLSSLPSSSGTPSAPSCMNSWRNFARSGPDPALIRWSSLSASLAAASPGFDGGKYAPDSSASWPRPEPTDRVAMSAIRTAEIDK